MREEGTRVGAEAVAEAVEASATPSRRASALEAPAADSHTRVEEEAAAVEQVYIAVYMLLILYLIRLFFSLSWCVCCVDGSLLFAVC